MVERGTLIGERPSTQVHERPARLSRQVMVVLVLVVALAIGLAVVLTSGDDVVTQDLPGADTDAVPYTGDWKDMLVDDGG